MQHTYYYHKFVKYVFLFIFIALGAWIFRGHKQPIAVPRDFAAIKASGVLRVAVEYNKLNFYVDSTGLAGFNYEIVKAFARDMKLRVDIRPVMSETERLEALRKDTIDLLACNLPSTIQMKDSLLLSSPIMLNKQVLIQRKRGIGKAPYIKSQLDLARKTINVPQNSPAILRIQNLSNEIGDTIYIKEIKQYSSEQLMYMVEHGDIDYAVCDENIAKQYAPHLPHIDMQMAISFTQFYSWGMSKHSPQLLRQFNGWIEQFKKTAEYKHICRKYVENLNLKQK